MKIFEILDEEAVKEIGTLLYYEKSYTCVIELRDDLDEWTAPLLFAGLVKKGIYTIPRELSILWVRERVIPSGRQNIGAILSQHKLREYDEMKFLELSQGRCSQDPLCVQASSTLPEYVAQRMRRNLTECIPCKDRSLLCFFADDTIRKVNLGSLCGRDTDAEIEKILKNERLFQSAAITAGGYSVTFDDAIDLPAAVLYRSGENIPLQPGDFRSFIQKNVPDTTESCALLGCSRQNLSYLVSQGQVEPVKKDVKGSLFLKGDILRKMW